MPKLHSTQSRLFLWLLVMLLAVPLVAATPTAHAASLLVTNLNDSGMGSLRQAIVDANLTPDGDTITFSVTGVIALTSGELMISSPITITGPAGGLTISGNNSSRIFTIDSAGSLSLDGLTLTGGNSTSAGGAISNAGTAILSRTQVLGNTTTATAGAISNLSTGVLTVTHSLFDGNSASFLGGAIDNYGGRAWIEDSTFSHNSTGTNAGAINNEGTMSLIGSTLSENTAVRGGAFQQIRGTATISGSTISSNTASTYSGGINLINGSLTLANSTVSNNTASGSGGGAIRSSGTSSLTILSSTLSGNVAQYGGGIWSTAGSISISDSTIRENGATSADGGGINLDTSTATIQNTTIISNTAQTHGGGIRASATLTITGSTISGNTAQSDGGGIFNINGRVSVATSTVSDNTGTYGGGIENVGSSATVSIDDSTISGNTARQLGGGLDNYQASMAVTQSTLSGNVAQYGGGIWSDSTLSIKHATITLNSGSSNGGGIRSAGATSIGHSIVAGNSASNTAKDIFVAGGSVTSTGYNLIGNNDGSSSSFPEGQPNTNNDSVGTSAVPISAQLGPLADYGGPTLTHATLQVSPANNAGDPSFVAPPSTDQRGEPRVLGGRIDIGAVEFEDSMQSGASLVVNTTADPGADSQCTLAECTLREAISAANVLNDATSISFRVNGTITLGSGELSISTPIQIDEPAGGITISGNNSSRIFNVGAAGSLTLSGLTLTAGRGNGVSGGALVNAGTASLDGTQLLANSTSANGGAIHNTGTLTLTESLIQGNTATGAGGGIWSTAGRMSISDSTISGNRATNADGGGINLNATLATIENSSITGNAASTTGGGIRNGGAGGVLTVSNSTLHANTSSNWGGAIYNESTLTLGSSTISNNQATNRGGGIFNNGTLTAKHSTITGNQVPASGGIGGGLRQNSGAVTLYHMLIAENTAASGPDFRSSGGTVTTQGFNLIGKNGIDGALFPAGQPNVNNDLVGTNAAPLNPLLGALADNGGPTWTHLPLPGSPALDQGSPNPNSLPSTDQRGEARVQNGRIDIGAVEHTPNQIAISDTSILEGDSGTATATFTITSNASSSEAITLSYATTDGSALVGHDYTAISGTLTLAPGTLSQTVTVDVLNDQIDEDDETFSVIVGGPPTVTMVDGEGVATIQDNDAAPAISISDASSAEGNASTTPLTFSVTLAAPSAKPISVAYTTVDATATAGADYTAISGTLLFAPGDVEQTFTVSVVGDLMYEPTETFQVTLNGAQNATVTDGQATGTIVDDDVDPCTSYASPYTVAAGDTAALIAAITCANASADTNVITLTTSTYSFTAGDANDSTTALPPITTPITINGNGAIIERSSGATADFRLFSVSRSGTLTLNSVTVRGGKIATTGGGIESTGTLSVINSTISANSATNGGGIYAEAATLINTTIAGNTASGDGGGIYKVGSQPVSIVNSVIIGNKALERGGGVYATGGDTITVRSSTVAGNSAATGGSIQTNGTAAIWNSIVWGNSSQLNNGGALTISYSLVEGGYAGTDNIDADPLFVSSVDDSLAPTTSGDYSLQMSSPAVGTGSNAALPADSYDLDGDGNTAETIPYDRAGNARIVDTSVDLGAYEHQATSNPTNQSPTLDQPAGMTILEDVGVQTVSLSGIGVGAGESQTLRISAVSSNPALIPNPSVSYSNPNATGSLSFTPLANVNGTATITITVQDSGGTSSGGVDTLTRSFTVTVTPVNDAPSFTPGPNQTVAADAGPQMVAGWASGFTAGPADEADQTLLGYTLLSNSDPELFAVAPAIDASGTLTYTPKSGARGTATISVVARDSGGVANGGVDTSLVQTFTITLGGSYQIYLPVVLGA